MFMIDRRSERQKKLLESMHCPLFICTYTGETFGLKMSYLA